ncbi:MAG: winged helix-turn-helix transcriptional regulator [Candidatus Hadarchaeaceae archaeon]
MKISDMLEAPCARILFFLHGRGEVRYSKLARLIVSRGTLSLNLKHLGQEGLVQRRIVATKPIQSLYSLTEKGSRVARKLADVRKALRG